MRNRELVFVCDVELSIACSSDIVILRELWRCELLCRGENAPSAVLDEDRMRVPWLIMQRDTD